MAVVKLVKSKNDEYYLMNCIRYLVRKDKNSQGLYGGRNIVITENPYQICGQFQAVGKLYAKNNPIIPKHFILSFDPDCPGEDLSPYQVDIIAQNLCIYLFEFCDYQIMYGIHDDRYCPHIHFLINPINLYTGRMFHFDREEQKRLFENIYFVLKVGGFWKNYCPIKLLWPMLYEEDSLDNNMQYPKEVKARKRKDSNGNEYEVAPYVEYVTIPLQFKVLFHIAIFGGLRRGELIALQWDDIDFEENTISITKSTAYAKRQSVEKAPKTKASKRVIKMPDMVMELLAEYKEQYDIKRSELGTAWATDEEGNHLLPYA